MFVCDLFGPACFGASFFVTMEHILWVKQWAEHGWLCKDSLRSPSSHNGGWQTPPCSCSWVQRAVTFSLFITLCAPCWPQDCRTEVCLKVSLPRFCSCQHASPPLTSSPNHSSPPQTHKHGVYWQTPQLCSLSHRCRLCDRSLRFFKPVITTPGHLQSGQFQWGNHQKGYSDESGNN